MVGDHVVYDGTRWSKVPQKVAAAAQNVRFQHNLSATETRDAIEEVDSKVNVVTAKVATYPQRVAPLDASDQVPLANLPLRMPTYKGEMGCA